jgi:osmotically-inducible protein OsmY
MRITSRSSLARGKVTLKGRVRSDDEKKAIETKATEVAGAGNVVDELTVKESGEKGSSQQ